MTQIYSPSKATAIASGIVILAVRLSRKGDVSTLVITSDHLPDAAIGQQVDAK